MGTITRRLDGRPVAESLSVETRRRLAAAPAGTPAPVLASVHRPGNGPFEVYRRHQAKSAEALGIRFRDVSLAEGDGPTVLRSTLHDLGDDPTVHAVLVEHPLPAEYNFHDALDALPLDKDVDGVSSRSLGRLLAHQPVHTPAVARAALAITRHYALATAGERTVVVGRSETVGIPLGLLLLERGVDATVTIAHSKTRDLSGVLSGASTIYSCVGRPGLLDRSNVPEGASVIDVGLSTIPDAGRTSGMRSVGDAAPELDGWAGALTPVPGGVGPVTVAELMQGVVAAWARAEGVA